VLVQSASWIFLNGTISADGLPAAQGNFGAGSGGTVIISANTINGTGIVSACGAVSTLCPPNPSLLSPWVVILVCVRCPRNQAGASGSKPSGSGGGGRILIELPANGSLSLNQNNIKAFGGMVPNSACLTGGAGTIVYQFTQPDGSVSRQLQVGACVC
jgi:hypothetical protein